MVLGFSVIASTVHTEHTGRLAYRVRRHGRIRNYTCYTHGLLSCCEGALLKIWVDADACPVVVRDILFKAAERTGVELILVANQPLRVPPLPMIRAVQVSAGFDVADNHIVQSCVAGDLVITSDIPLAAEVIDKGALALNPRGERYTRENIRGRLNMRDFMETLRSSGIQSGGQGSFGQREKQAFANQLDQILARRPT